MPHKRKDLKIEGSDLWYLVGLVSSDGSLSSDARHIDITSKDYNFLKSLVARLKIRNKVCIKNRGTNKQAYRIQIANKNFYDFLLSIGLTQNKSCTLGALNIPRHFFVDFLRGLIDGDGSLRSWIHPTNLHEQWSLRIYSGSQAFMIWLRARIEEYIRCTGRVHSEFKSKFKRFVYTLKYGKIAAKKIFSACYYDGAFGMDRKMKLAESCLKTSAGWRQSKTVI